MTSGTDRGNLIIKINDINYSLGTSTSSGTCGLGKTGINCGYNSSTSTLITSEFKGSICDFKIYDGNNITHWYPLTEGEGTIATDVIGTVNGTITATSVSNFWANTQNVFTYTVGNRFTPVSFKGKISGNNCATFNGNNQYILLANQSISDVTKVSFSVKINAIHSDASKLYSIFAGFNLRCNFGIRKNTAAHFCLWVGDGEHTGIFEITTLTVTVGSIYNVEVSFDYNSGYSCIVNGNSYTLSFVNSNTPSALNVYTLLGASRNTSNANYQPSYCNLWNFKCYNSNNELTHWYPLAEGSNTIAYDVVGNMNGIIASTSLSTFWGTKQDVFAYNAINGYKVDAQGFSNTRLPIGVNDIIFDTEKLGNNTSIGGINCIEFALPTGSTSSFSDGVASITVTGDADTNYIYAKLDRTIKAGETVYVDFQRGDVGWTEIFFATAKSGGTRTSSDLGNRYNTPSGIYSVTITGDTPYLVFTKNTTSTTRPFTITAKFKVYKTDLITYPAISNGIPPCESNIDFTQGISNIAELKNVDSAISIKSPDLVHDNFGADSGSGWTVGTLSASVTGIGNWNANYNGDYSVKYIHNTTLTQTDIDYGITNAIDISTGSNPGGTNASQFYTTQNFSTYANKTVFIDISFKIKPYEIIPDILLRSDFFNNGEFVI